jgi:hypothetical protein
MKPCSIKHHFLQGSGIHCSCGLPFESINHLAYHISSEPVHVDLKPGRCAFLATWYRHVETSDKSRTETFDSNCYGPHTRFIFRSADDVRNGSLPLPTAYRLPHSGEDSLSIWLFRSNQDRTETPVLKGSKKSTLLERYQERHRIFGMDSHIITITFAALARIFLKIISSSLRTASPSLPADDHNVAPCSVMITAMALDELAVATSSGRRGNVVSMNDSDLEHLAHLCVAAELFEFDVRISNAHIETVSQLYELSFPATPQLGVECHAVIAGYWLRFDSHELCEAFLRYRQGFDVGLARRCLSHPSIDHGPKPSGSGGVNGVTN